MHSIIAAASTHTSDGQQHIAHQRGKEKGKEMRVYTTKKFKSFSRCDEWISRNERAILENQLFYIVVEDNDWSVAYKLIQKDNYYYNNIVGLQAKHYQSYLDGMKKALFNQFETIGIYGSAWTSGVIHRDKQAV